MLSFSVLRANSAATLQSGELFQREKLLETPPHTHTHSKKTGLFSISGIKNLLRREECH